MNPDTHQLRRHAWLYIVGVLPFLALAAWHWQYGPLAAFGDWAQYMLHADAIRNGRAYGDIGYIFTSRNPFIGPPVQPPGLPVVLAPILAVTDGARDGAPYKAFMVAWTLAFLGLVVAYFDRLGHRALGVVAAAMTGVGLEVGFATNVVQPDVPFCAMLWGAFYLADKPGPWTWPRVAGISVLSLAALAFRLAAIPLFPALLLYAVLHRRDQRRHLWVPVAVWVLCGLVAAVAIPGVLTFARLVPLDVAGLTENVVEAAKIYPLAVFELFLYPFPWDRANDAYHALVAGLACIGLAGWVRQAPARLVTLVAFLYVGMLILIPMRDGRYLMPLAPLAIYAAASGLVMVIGWAARRSRRNVSDARARGVAVVTFGCIIAMALTRDVTGQRPTVLLEAPGIHRLFDRLAAEHSRAPMRVVFMNPRVLTWRTGVPAMGFFRAAPDTTLVELRDKGITHVVVGDLDTDPMHASSIRDAVAARPAAFRPLFTEGPFTVYAVEPTGAGGPP